MGAHENPRAEIQEIHAAMATISERRAEAMRLYIKPLDDEFIALSERVCQVVSRTYGIPLEHVVAGGWPCPDSITGRCVYNDDEDPYHDDCVICHDPSERK